jgi:hypothetical protein
MISHQKQQINLPDYIPLLQSEDILKTAEYRQNLVDQNLSSVKDAVDSYSKLRSYMINDNARNYFDQELKKLTSTIRDSAGLDFSNKGNLANVLAIGKPFENDKYIVNGLKWGKEKQRRVSELSSIDDKLRNSDNDLVFMNDIYEYEREGGLDSKVNTQKSYTPYVDVTEEVLKIEKDIEGKMLLQQQNIGGGYINFREVELKTAEEVKNRIRNLSPEMQQQISIHAQANMIRMGKENTYKIVKESQLSEYQEAEELANRARIGLAQLNATGKKDSTTRQLMFEAQTILKQAETTMKVLKDELQKPADQYNPNDYIKIFEENFLSQIAQKAAYQKTKNNIKENIIGMENLRSSNRIKEINAQTAAEMNREEIKLIQKDTQIDTAITHEINVPLLASNPKLVPYLAGKATPENINALKNEIRAENGRLQAKGLQNLTEREKQRLDYYNGVAVKLEQIAAVLSRAKSDDYIDFGVEKSVQQGASPITAISTRQGAENYSLEDVLETGYFGLRTKLPKKSASTNSTEETEEKQPLSYFDQLADLQERADVAKASRDRAMKELGISEEEAENKPEIKRLNEEYKAAKNALDSFRKGS